MSVGFLALLALVAVHLFANHARVLGWLWHGRFLSFAAGISFAYVFVDLLPTLEKGQPILRQALEQVIPYFDRHVYLIALFGVLFFYGLHTDSKEGSKRSFWLAMGGYVIFNFFVGASLSDSTNPDIQPIALFTVAMAMHYFVNDHNAEMEHPQLYESSARWFLVASLFLGYAVGYLTHIPDPIVVIVISFLSGGIFLNALRYELPKREQVGYMYFLAGSLIYTAILFGVGEI